MPHALIHSWWSADRTGNRVLVASISYCTNGFSNLKISGGWEQRFKGIIKKDDDQTCELAEVAED